MGSCPDTDNDPFLFGTHEENSFINQNFLG